MRIICVMSILTNYTTPDDISRSFGGTQQKNFFRGVRKNIIPSDATPPRRGRAEPPPPQAEERRSKAGARAKGRGAGPRLAPLERGLCPSDATKERYSATEERGLEGWRGLCSIRASRCIQRRARLTVHWRFSAVIFSAARFSAGSAENCALPKKSKISAPPFFRRSAEKRNRAKKKRKIAVSFF